MEELNLHNQQWTFTEEQSGLSLFNGEYPFKDGQVETLDGLPKGAAIPNLTETPQEFSPGLDKEQIKISKSFFLLQIVKIYSGLYHTSLV